jgi:hypothetical protein
MPYLERPDGVKIHWSQQGSGPLVVLAPYAIARRSPSPGGAHGPRTTRATRGGRVGTGSGSFTPRKRPAAGFPRAKRAGGSRRLFPQAPVEEVEDGMISRPDLTGAFVRRVTAKARSPII